MYLLVGHFHNISAGLCEILLGHAVMLRFLLNRDEMGYHGREARRGRGKRVDILLTMDNVDRSI